MNRTFIRYLTIIGVGNLIGLNVGGLLYLHWAKKFRDPHYRSRTFAPLHWFGLGILTSVGLMMLFGIVPREKFKVKLIFYEIHNPHALLVAGIFIALFLVVLLGLYLHHRVSSNQSLKVSA